MAEFVQVMKDWRRMCKAYTTDDDSCCEGCPVVDFREHGCGAIFDMEDGTDWQRYADTIMSWAAEHPEPVYPTWLEYLMNAFPDCGKAYMGGNDLLWKWMWETPIPADKAERLGIEPKEG